MTRLLVVVPTRGRPHAVKQMVQAWQDTDTTDASLLFGVDDDDPALDQYRAAIASLDPDRLGFEVLFEVGPRKRMIGTLNDLATKYAGDYAALGFMGDDHRPRTTQWDARFLDCLGEGTGIVYGNDMIQRDAMATEVAMTSDIVTTLGYMAPPELTHLCADVVWCEWGRAIGRLTYLPDVVIEHLHPVAGTGAWDDTYADANSVDVNDADANAFAAYRASGRFDRDVVALRGLIQ